jgi:hypothetical protein
MALQWEFPHKLAIHKAATFAEWIMSLGLSDAHPPLHHERVIAICAPLFMEKRHALTTAIGNNGRAQFGSIGRAPPPLSPPDISESGKGPCLGKRKGPIAGSYEMNVKAAGIR